MSRLLVMLLLTTAVVLGTSVKSPSLPTGARRTSVELQIYLRKEGAKARRCESERHRFKSWCPQRNNYGEISIKDCLCGDLVVDFEHCESVSRTM